MYLSNIVKVSDSMRGAWKTSIFRIVLPIGCGVLLSSSLMAQQSSASQPGITANLSNSQASTPPIQITLAEAEQRALKIEPTLLAAQAAQKSAGYDRTIARSALLPQADIVGQYLFTESNGRPFGGTLPNESGPVFIANNAVHEYISQFVATEDLSLASVARYRQAGALALRAKAEAEIASRGLVAVVTQAYYSVLAADRKLQAAQEAAQEAQNFVNLTKKLESGREVAHSDVLKAELQLEQRQRDQADATLAATEAREALGVLLFPDPTTPYALADPLSATAPLPDENQVRALAGVANPELRSAMADVKASDADVLASRAGYLPTLSFDYNYGLDAPMFARIGPAGERFLGYSASAGINIPVWDWFATHSHVKQSELRRHLARASLDLTQRQLIAQLHAAYGELTTAATAVASLTQSVEQARESLHLSTLRYQAGEATVVEVVDAQNTYLTTETMAADGAVRYHVARANLERLTGRLP